MAEKDVTGSGSGPRLDAKLRQHAAEFYAVYPNGPDLMAAIVRSGWTPSFLHRAAGPPHEIGRPEWVIRARPPMEIAASFDLQVEVLFYVSDFKDLQARTVQAARLCVERDPRVSRDVAFLVTADSDADAKIGQIPRSDGIVPLPWDWIHDAATGGEGDKPLRSRLEKFLFARDLFDVQIPVVGNRFFGRHQTLQFLTRHAVSDQPVGIFGLRKIGKTSLIKTFVEQAIEGSSGDHFILPVHVDLQAVPPGRRDQTYLLWEIGKRAVRVMHQHADFVGAMPRLKLFGIDGPPPPDADASLGFDSDLRKYLDFASRDGRQPHFVVILDEVERLIPPGKEERGFDGAVEILRYLRGLNQEGTPISLVIAGANPYVAERAHISGQENPLLNSIVKHYLPPLNDDEARQMIQRLGGMMGVKFHHEAAGAVVNHAGGHPFLTRQLCSVAIKRAGHARPITLGLGDVERALGEFSASQHHTFEQMFDSLSDYPDEQFLLRQLARGEYEFVRAWAQDDPIGVEHLKGYGLIEAVGDTWEFTIPLFREYVFNAIA